MNKKLLWWGLLILNVFNCSHEILPKPASEFKLYSAQFGLVCMIHLKLFNLNYQSVDIVESIIHSNAEPANTFTQCSSNDTVVVNPVHTYFESCTINLIVIMEDYKHTIQSRLEMYFMRTMYPLTNARKLSNYIIVRENLQEYSDIPRVVVH